MDAPESATDSKFKNVNIEKIKAYLNELFSLIFKIKHKSDIWLEYIFKSKKLFQKVQNTSYRNVV